MSLIPLGFWGQGLSYEPILDNYPSKVGYSLRLIRSLYTEPLFRIKNSITNIETDIYPDSTGFFSKSTVENNTASGIAKVITIYDQSGNDHHLSSVSGVAKVYDSSTGFYVKNGIETIYFDSAYFEVSISDLSANNSPKTFINLWTSNSTPENTIYIEYANGWDYFLNSIIYRYAGNGLANLSYSLTLAANTDYLLSITHDSSDMIDMYLDGVLVRNEIRTNVNQGSILRVGRISRINGTTNSYFKELIGYNSDESANLSTIEQNIIDYYNL
jgi:hypothetical protein